MSGHLEREQIAALLTPEGSRPARTAAVRHLLARCTRCAALARQVLRENGYTLKGGRVNPLPADRVPPESYDAVLERLIRRLPELRSRAGEER
jgi:hypothetical protein